MAQTLSQIKSLLAAHGLTPRHRLGQNFLHDHHHMQRILAAADLIAGELVLEVGAGTGALSEHLLDAGARLVAVEIDRELEPILRGQLERYGERVMIVVADALAGKHALNPVIIEALRAMAWNAGGVHGEGIAHATGDAEAIPPFKLVANLPYNIASPLVANLAADYPMMTRAVVMVQREVADRLLAKPGGKDYGPLGVLIQALCEVEKVATLSPTCFWPSPQVGSAVVLLRRRARALCDDPRALSSLLQMLFGQRRKQIGAILRSHGLLQLALPAGVDPTQRPEQLSVEQLSGLARTIAGV